MLYETRILGHEQTTGRAGYEQGKMGSTKVILENQLNNSRTLKQTAEFVRGLKLISDKKLEKVVAMYK